MPLIFSNRGVNNFVNYFEHNIGGSSYSVVDLLNVVYFYFVRFIKFAFNLQFIVTIHSYLYFGPEGIRRNVRTERSWTDAVISYDPTSTSDTIIRIDEIDENTPLLTHSKNNHTKEQQNFRNVQFCELRIMAIIFIFIAGFIIATYLLIMESRAPTLGLALDLVNHDIWSRVSVSHENLINHTNIVNILIMQTGGENCRNIGNCLRILREMQTKLRLNNVTDEIPYNFLIAGDGRTYEVRGWDRQSGLSFFPQQSLIVIGFLGNFTNTRPSDVYLQSALSLIHESLRRKKLQKYYKIYGLRNLTISHQDGAALFNEISKWPRFDTLLQVL